jgi:hypothetical protein
MPYEPWDDEFTIQLHVNKVGMYSVITKNVKNGRKGFCTHIGKADHVPDSLNNIKIVVRNDFPDKRKMSMKDI